MIKPQIGADRSSHFGHRIVGSEIDLLGFKTLSGFARLERVRWGNWVSLI
jgi:hypothetical protein